MPQAEILMKAKFSSLLMGIVILAFPAQAFAASLSPLTGDTTNLFLYGGLALVAVVGGGAFFAINNKKKKEQSESGE